ncbi:hypothetical protein CEXT_452751 [Caerostris extrusa]|uniref:Uncharacterized protein n=1 Tax=Caerostris extrusa TaxID=172846 RepID=A0AAV4RKN1_CAEEX|nr:hypothetical protein CEXT_452751 [Caerostris extrusa]
MSLVPCAASRWSEHAETRQAHKRNTVEEGGISAADKALPAAENTKCCTRHSQHMSLIQDERQHFPAARVKSGLFSFRTGIHVDCQFSREIGQCQRVEQHSWVARRDKSKGFHVC